MYLVHKEGGNGTRVRLVVEPKEFSTMGLGLCFCAGPALIGLLCLSTGPWI